MFEGTSLHNGIRQKLAGRVGDANLPAATLARAHAANRLHSDGVIIFLFNGMRVNANASSPPALRYHCRRHGVGGF